MRLIDADALECALKDTKIGLAIDKGKMFWLIENAPTVDATLVIRCNFCKHYDAKYENCEFHSNPPGFFDPGLDVEMKPDDFCSYGERRPDGQT